MGEIRKPNHILSYPVSSILFYSSQQRLLTATNYKSPPLGKKKKKKKDDDNCAITVACEREKVEVRHDENSIRQQPFSALKSLARIEIAWGLST